MNARWEGLYKFALTTLLGALTTVYWQQKVDVTATLRRIADDVSQIKIDRAGESQKVLQLDMYRQQADQGRLDLERRVNELEKQVYSLMQRKHINENYPPPPDQRFYQKAVYFKPERRSWLHVASDRI